MRTAIEGNDPGFMNHLGINHHIPGRLNDLVKAIVARLDAKLSARTFWNFVREFSSFQTAGSVRERGAEIGHPLLVLLR